MTSQAERSFRAVGYEAIITGDPYLESKIFDYIFRLILTLRAVGTPMIMTTVTTMVGFLSMLFVESAAMRTIGLCASAGILLAGVVTWTTLPAVLMIVRFRWFSHPDGACTVPKRQRKSTDTARGSRRKGSCRRPYPGIRLSSRREALICRDRRTRIRKANGLRR